MSDLSEMRHESDPGSSVGTSDVRPSAQPVDDWLGDVSDEDWSEHVDTRPGRGYGAGYGGLAAPVGDHDGEPEGAGPPPGRAVDAAEARRLAVRRRRIVAGVVAVAALAVGIAGAVVLAGGDDEASATFPSEPVATTPVATDGTTTTPATTTPSDTTTTPTTPPSDTTTTPTTPPATDGSSFTLPEGTKLRPGEEADPAVVTELQRALKSVGYDPGPIDGTYGQKTVAAVAAFQQANGLSTDGAVGPETAAALNDALTAG